MEITLNDVKEYLKANAEKDDVKTYLAGFVKDESKIIEDYKKTTDFKSEIDRAVTKGIKTFEEKTLPEREKSLRTQIENEFNPPKTDSEKALEKRIKELEEETNKTKTENARAKRINYFNEKLAENKIDFDFIKFVDGSLNDDDAMIEHIANLNKKIYQSGVDFKLNTQASNPKKSDGSTMDQIGREDLKNMSSAEIMKAKEEGKLNEILGRTKLGGQNVC